MPRIFLATAALSSLLAPSLQAVETLFSLPDAVLTGGVENGQNVFLPTSPTGGGKGGTVTINPASKDLVFDNGASSATYDFFIAKFDETILEVGKKLTLSYSLTGTGLNQAGRAFRAGLYWIGPQTSGNSTANLNGQNYFKQATGFRVDLGTNDSGNRIYRKNQHNSYPDLWNSSAYATLDHGEHSAQSDYTIAIATGGIATITGSLSIELLSEDASSVTLRITSVVGSNEAWIETTQTNAWYKQFNAIALGNVATTSGGSSLTFSNLTVTYAAVPEPAVTTAFIGVFAFLGILFCRHRGRRTG
ncbi:hypothetical protein OPIT5_12075 [Opitutaceae bacterium TAV5]|nr:hypothetical protein OPIT5_12075 [Opitutaceae bacterium TAV5]